jgi:membrane-bound lytic murein transglycosylase B
MKPRFLVAVLALGLLISGCAGKPAQPPVDVVPQAQEPGAKLPTVVGSAPLRGVREPWAKLAGRLRAEGLPESNLAAFFNSPDLSFNPSPMVTKLRELFGIFFRSDLTKSVQEKLYQLGYDVLIDGRWGSGTKKAVQAFQSDHGLQATGRVSEELDKRLSATLLTGKTRDLSSYKPPPAPAPSRSATHSQFTNPTAIGNIRNHYLADKPIFDAMEQAFGVPGPLVASIMWIETGYGSYFGKSRAAYSLASMAAASDYSLVAGSLNDLDTNQETRAFMDETAEKRGAWAADELSALLRYAWQNGLDPATFPGSIYGAIGYGQFMPSNIAKFAVDGNGDGRVDLFDKTDAVFSIGRYLRDSGWHEPMVDEEARRKVIMLYNRSGVYVNTVLYVARAIGG